MYRKRNAEARGIAESKENLSLVEKESGRIL